MNFFSKNEPSRGILCRESIITFFMASFTKNVGYLAKWIRKALVRFGRLSNVGSAGSIPLGQKFCKKEKFFVDQNFCPIGMERAGPKLLNLPDRTDGFPIHFAK